MIWALVGWKVVYSKFMWYPKRCDVKENRVGSTRLSVAKCFCVVDILLYWVEM